MFMSSWGLIGNYKGLYEFDGVSRILDLQKVPL